MQIKYIFLLVLLSLAGVFTLLQEDEIRPLTLQTATGQALAVKVITRPVQEAGNDRVFEAIGTGRARLSVDIYPMVAGEVTEVRFVAEDRVEQGQLLVQLDKREQILALRLAEVELREAQNLLTRYEQAVKDGAVPESEVDSARADVESAQVALEQARVALDFRQIKAPFSGVLGIPRVEPGDRVNTSTLVSGLDDREVLHVDFEIPESLAGLVQAREGRVYTVTTTTPAFSDQEFRATVSARESRLDPQKRTLLVRANIANTDDLLRPGMSFRIRWEIAGTRHPSVPEIALQWGREGSFIWVVRNNKAEKVPARVIARNAGQVLVDSMAGAGEPVVVEGLQRLDDGVEVDILSVQE